MTYFATGESSSDTFQGTINLALTKLKSSLNRIVPDLETQLHLFDTVISPVFLYGREISEQIKVFHGNFPKKEYISVWYTQN